MTINHRTRVQESEFYSLIVMTNLPAGEKARICAAGGFVDFGRVNGNLALSRAIGDFEFKKSAELSPEQQIVTAFPDVISHTITDDDEFLVIACDGTQYPIKLANDNSKILQAYGIASLRKPLLNLLEEGLQQSKNSLKFAKT